jgi:hypothetical protein
MGEALPLEGKRTPPIFEKIPSHHTLWSEIGIVPLLSVDEE